MIRQEFEAILENLEETQSRIEYACDKIKELMRENTALSGMIKMLEDKLYRHNNKIPL